MAETSGQYPDRLALRHDNRGPRYTELDEAAQSAHSTPPVLDLFAERDLLRAVCAEGEPDSVSTSILAGPQGGAGSS